MGSNVWLDAAAWEPLSAIYMPFEKQREGVLLKYTLLRDTRRRGEHESHVGFASRCERARVHMGIQLAAAAILLLSTTTRGYINVVYTNYPSLSISLSLSFGGVCCYSRVCQTVVAAAAASSRSFL